MATQEKKAAVLDAARRIQAGDDKAWRDFFTLVDRDLTHIAYKNTRSSDYGWEDFRADLEEKVFRDLPKLALHDDWNFELYFASTPKRFAQEKRSLWLFAKGITQDEFRHLGLDDQLGLTYEERSKMKKADLNLLRQEKALELGKTEVRRLRSAAISGCAGDTHLSDLTTESDTLGTPDKNDSYEDWFVALDFLDPMAQYIVICAYELGMEEKPLIEIDTHNGQIPTGLSHAASMLGISRDKARRIHDKALIEIGSKRYGYVMSEVAA